MCMLKSYFQRLFADPNSTASLVRRPLLEQAAGQWRRYALAFGLMGIAAASTALGAYLIGDVINQAYVHKNLPGIIVLALVTAVIFISRQWRPMDRHSRWHASAIESWPTISGGCSPSCCSI